MRNTSPLNCLHRPRTIPNPTPLFEPVTYQQQKHIAQQAASNAAATTVTSETHQLHPITQLQQNDKFTSISTVSDNFGVRYVTNI